MNGVAIGAQGVLQTKHGRQITKDASDVGEIIINMKHQEREYSIYSKRDGWKDLVSRGEWATWVKAGKRGSINQIVGWFRSAGISSWWLMVSTGPSNRKNRAAGEWESRVLDSCEIDLVNPSYCRGSVKEIEAMHGRAVSNARKWLRNYVERPIHYSENILTRRDPLHLAKTPDFEVDYFDEDEDDKTTKTTSEAVHYHRQGPDE